MNYKEKKGGTVQFIFSTIVGDHWRLVVGVGRRLAAVGGDWWWLADVDGGSWWLMAVGDWWRLVVHCGGP